MILLDIHMYLRLKHIILYFLQSKYQRLLPSLLMIILNHHAIDHFREPLEWFLYLNNYGETTE